MSEDITQPTEKTSAEALVGLLRIVILSLIAVLICVSFGFAIAVLNERNTQQNANRQERANEALLAELACLRSPQFESDRADAHLAIVTARGLAAVAVNDDVVLAQLADDLQEGASDLERAIQLRGESLSTCTSTPVPPETD